MEFRLKSQVKLETPHAHVSKQGLDGKTRLKTKTKHKIKKLCMKTGITGQNTFKNKYDVRAL